MATVIQDWLQNMNKQRMNTIMKSLYEQIGGTYSENETGHMIPDLSYAPAEQFPICIILLK